MGEPIVGALPGVKARLVREVAAAESLGAYRSDGGYLPLTDGAALLEVVASSGLLGRGGAAFPLAVKVRAVLEHAKSAGVAPVVLANGEEGEPASLKDRWLLRHRPHLVLDGLRLAARMTGADQSYVYVSDPAAAAAVEKALEELHESWIVEVPISVRTVDPAYVAGEETAAVRAIDGGPAKPTDKPPRPFQSGIGGRPTLVSNVETLANLPYLLREGAQEFRAEGTAASPGTFLVTLNGGGRAPGLYEVAHGTPMRELLAHHGIPADEVRGALMGGYFAGLLNRRVLDVTLCHEVVRGAGSGLGCGSINVLTEECPVAVAAAVMGYFDRENAGQCGSCFNGTAAMHAVLAALRDGNAGDDDLVRLEHWSTFLPKRGACGTLDGAAKLARTLLDEFGDEVANHRANGCASCATAPSPLPSRPFEVEAVTLV